MSLNQEHSAVRIHHNRSDCHRVHIVRIHRFTLRIPLRSCNPSRIEPLEATTVPRRSSIAEKADRHLRYSNAGPTLRCLLIAQSTTTPYIPTASRDLPDDREEMVRGKEVIRHVERFARHRPRLTAEDDRQLSAPILVMEIHLHRRRIDLYLVP